MPCKFDNSLEAYEIKHGMAFYYSFHMGLSSKEVPSHHRRHSE